MAHDAQTSNQAARKQIIFAFAIAASYLALIGIATWQALRGQSIIDPDSAALAAIAIWFGATAAAIYYALGIKLPERASLAARYGRNPGTRFGWARVESRHPTGVKSFQIQCPWPPAHAWVRMKS